MERLTVMTDKGAALAMGGPYENEQAVRDDLMARYRVAVARLAAYEDTGLTPERVAELAQAERDGRLVVLPVEPWFGPTRENEVYICENGEVWPIYVTGCEAGPNADGVFTVTYMTLDGDVFTADDIGKTIFLTRQEAEEAMQKEGPEG